MILIILHFLCFHLADAKSALTNDPRIHEFHISKCNINYHSESQSVQIVLNIFIDDLEMVLEKAGHKNLHLCTDREVPEANDYLDQYITNQLAIFLDDKQYEPNYIGKEVSEDLIAVWCYYEINDVKLPASIALSNTILLDAFDDQKNIINVEVNSQRQAYWLFDKKYSSDKVDL